MNDPELFIVQPVTFEQGKTDPFGFDDLAEKVGGMYVPIAGVTKRIRYFAFIPFVDAVIKDMDILPREIRGVKRRLEKLFVYLAMHKYSMGRGSNLIGSSIDANNPFDASAGTWVSNDCYKLYSSSVVALGTKDESFKKHLQQHFFKPKHLFFIKTFLAKQGALDRYKVSWLEQQKQNIHGSIFDYSRKMPKPLYRYFLQNLQGNNKIEKLTRKYPDLFNKPDVYVEKIKQDRSTYPFYALNQFFSDAINAIQSDIEGNEKASLWVRAHESFKILTDKHKDALSKSKSITQWGDAQSQEQLIRGLWAAARSKDVGWFEMSGQHFTKGHGFNRIKGQWDSLVARIEKKEYSDFRLYALLSVINDINKTEGIR